jgi:hypothetical protein
MYRPDDSAAAEHRFRSGHQIKFQETETLAKTSGCQRSSRNKIISQQYKQRGKGESQQCMRSQHRVIEALQHTDEENPKKTQRRGCYKENKIIDNRDTG